MRFERVIWIVLDSVGIGAMPDAADYGDEGSDTLGNIAKQRPLDLPNLCRMGLANIKPMAGFPKADAPAAAYGKCTLASPGKDTTHRPLGNGRHHSGQAVPGVSKWLPA